MQAATCADARFRAGVPAPSRRGSLGLPDQGSRRAPRRRGQTARQVIVLTTPSADWIRSRIRRPMPGTSGASTWAMTSYSPVMASTSTMPSFPLRASATCCALPALAVTSTYARIISFLPRVKRPATVAWGYAVGHPDQAPRPVGRRSLFVAGGGGGGGGVRWAGGGGPG